jgi:CheY-like chemotaxis protein
LTYGSTLDNVDAADMLCALLAAMNCEAVAVYSGEQALTVASDFAPDVVFLDLGMPCMDGFETAHRLRVDEAVRGCRIIALTAWGGARTRRRVLEAGMNGHTLKPARIDAILEIIRGGTVNECDVHSKTD